jgi:Rrf2 family protein
MKVSRTVEYAVQATVQLAQSRTGGPVPCSQLAASSSMPERFLLQILRSLVTHGILSSTRGVVGGYLLQRRPEDITLLDLIEAIEGPLVGSIPSSPSLAEPTLAKLQKAVDEVTAAKRVVLSRVTLADLLSEAVAEEPAAPQPVVPKRA